MTGLLRAFLLAVAVAAPLCGAVQASERGARAEAFVAALTGEALAVIADKTMKPDTRHRRFAELLYRDFDLHWIGRFVLGRNWRAAEDDQRAEYLALFAETIVFTYSRRFEAYDGQMVRVTGHREGKRKKYVFVFSEIYDPEGAGPVISLTWRLFAEGEGFKIADVAIEGVSMGIAQRNEYASVIQRNGGRVDALIAAMRTNLERLRADG